MNDTNDGASTETPGGEDGFQIQETRARQTTTRMNAVMFGKLLSEQEINRVKDKFDEDTNNVLEEALRKHVSTFLNFDNF